MRKGHDWMQIGYRIGYRLLIEVYRGGANCGPATPRKVR